MVKWRRPVLRAVNLLAALIVLAGLLYAGVAGAGPLPPLGAMLNPGTGVWTTAADAHTPGDSTLHMAGLQAPVHVVYDANGTAHINAGNTHDLFMTIGYLHATNRLFQMDLMRRQAEGLLSQVVGPAALSSDEFELQLGLLRTAEDNWQRLSPDDPARQVALAYTAGVNASMRQQIASGHLDVMFKMLGYQPAPWTPVDSLAIQGIMTQTLAFSEGPLQYAMLVKSLGYDRTMSWFPVIAQDQNTQHPYDPGPYKSDPPAAFDTPLPTAQVVSNTEAASVGTLLAQLDALPSNAVRHEGASNNWAVDGTKTASGKPLMAGDPHLDQTIPAIWYQIDANSPGYQVAGVTIPGLPVVLIGHNLHISWSLTDTQNGDTFYYLEQTDPAHPNQYFWKGNWQPMRLVQYTIPVKHSAPVKLTVQVTVHGPILPVSYLKGQAISVWWAGSLPSNGLAAMLSVGQASTFAQFRDALQQWKSPTQNFVYADDAGNIGLISPGYYPLVASGNPWLPLSGDGSADVVGTIPYSDVPQVYDPPDHIVWSANQREVGPDYPYYIGTSLEGFDPGYRADRIYQALSTGSNFTPADMEQLQNDTHDYLASLIVPKLVQALQAHGLSGSQQQAAQLLAGWDDNMSVDSPASTIWMRFWTQYLYDTFNPWWVAQRVPVKQDPSLALPADQTSYLGGVLGEDLVAWTLDDPSSSGFTLPNGTPRTAPAVMRQAFADTMTALTRQLGADPTTWTWGRVHSREFPNLAQIDGLGYGPRSASGDPWTVDAASDTTYLATHGPSWRFVMDWSTGQGMGVYPGGQSENPLSPWYENQVAVWWDGKYNSMLDFSQAQSSPGAHTWTIQP
jgi:penicillin G amidase